jgi:hypothetical protein
MKKANILGTALLLSLIATQTAQADTYGCTVLLCLSNPAGPEAVAECVQPIEQLYASLAKTPPDPFPTCPEAGAGNVAYQTSQHYALCPQGTSPAPAQSWVSSGGSDPQQSEPLSYDDSGYAYPGTGSQACVSGLINTYSSWGIDGLNSYLIYNYSTVIWQSYNFQNSIDVMNNGVLVERIFW